MMRRFLIVLAFASASAPAAAQQLAPRYTFAGCGVYTCFRMQMDLLMPHYLGDYVFFVDSWYRNLPAGVGGIPYSYWFADPTSIYDPEGYWGAWFPITRFQTGPWITTRGSVNSTYLASGVTPDTDLSVFYASTVFGPIGSEWYRMIDPDEDPALFYETVELHVTPEPASLLLLATGLLGLGARHRHRRSA